MGAKSEESHDGILVIGGGFAGMWGALAAARQRRKAGLQTSALPIRLVAPNHDLVIRPRLYEADPDRMRVPLDRVLDPVGVARLAATVTGIDPASRRVVAEAPGGTTELSYARVLVAVGSRVTRPDLPGAEAIHDIDTIKAAAALDAHLQRLPRRPPSPGRFTAVVVGAGFTGIELATELVGRLGAIADRDGAGDEVRIVLVERQSVVGPELGPGPRPEIERALAELGVETRLGVSVETYDRERLRLSDESELDAATVAWTAGMRAADLTASIPAPRDAIGRLEVDEHLRVPSSPQMFATGDAAAARDETGHPVMQSCQHALQLGRFAGHNAAADLLGLPLAPFAPDPYVTCLDLGPGGAVFTRGWGREVEVAGEVAKRHKRFINEVFIYPPLDDAEEILRAADPLPEVGAAA